MTSFNIVYSTGDLEDGVRKKLLDWISLKRELGKRSKGNDLVKKVIKEAEKKVGFNPKKPDLLNEDVTQAFRTFSIGAMKDATFEQFCRRYKKIMKGEYHGEIVRDDDCEAADFVRACTEIGVAYVYPSTPTLKLELMGRRVIHDLMNIFWEGAQICGTDDAPKPCKKGSRGKLTD